MSGGIFPSGGPGATAGSGVPSPANPLFRLGQSLRTRFGTAPQEPDLEQIARVIVDIEGILKKRTPVDADWEDSVKRHCPSTGSQFYPATDFSDLNAILEEIRRLLGDP
jgi:hypothetical protein